LGSLANFRNGINYNKSNFGTGIKVIGVSDFQDHVRASFDHLEEINPEGVVRKEHLLRDGDILFVRSNGNRELIGRSLFVNGLHENVTHSAFSIRLRFTSQQCCPRFYAYLFRSTLIRQALSMCGGGTNISNLNQGILERLEVPMPAMPTQERIASVLSAYDDLIENNTRRIKILEEMAQMLYREWFVNFRFPGHRKVKMVESELGPVPSGWRVTSLADLFPDESVVITGPFGSSLHESDYRAEGVPLVLVKHIKHGRILQDGMPLVGEHKLKEMMRYRLKQGDVVVTRVGYVGAAAYINSRQTGWILSGKMLRVRLPVLSPLQSRFLLQQYQLPEFQKKIENHAVGSTRMSLNVKILNDLPLLLPPVPLQDQFTAFVSPVDDGIESLRHRDRVLRTTRDFLLPKLISGEVPVEAAAEAMEQTA
jgi:type I restriction enzyme S subunit